MSNFRSGWTDKGRGRNFPRAGRYGRGRLDHGRGIPPATSSANDATTTQAPPFEPPVAQGELEPRPPAHGNRAPISGRFSGRGRGRESFWRGGRGFSRGRGMLMPNKTWVRPETGEANETATTKPTE